jgi:hypothetical protein
VSESVRPLWWFVVFPGLAITVRVLAFNSFGNALRDVLDPRLKGAEFRYRAIWLFLWEPGHYHELPIPRCALLRDEHGMGPKELKALQVGTTSARVAARCGSPPSAIAS